MKAIGFYRSLPIENDESLIDLEIEKPTPSEHDLLVQVKAISDKDKTILIIGAAGGVGSIAIQLASLAGLTVIGTASRLESIQWTRVHDATHTISHTQAFVPQLKSLGFPMIDYIFCLNSSDEHWNDLDALAPHLQWQYLRSRCKNGLSTLERAYGEEIEFLSGFFTS